MPLSTSAEPRRTRSPSMTRAGIGAYCTAPAVRPRRKKLAAEDVDEERRQGGEQHRGAFVPYSRAWAMLALSAISATVTGRLAPSEKVTPNRNSFQMLVNCQMTVTIRIGGDSGRMMRQKIWKKPGAVDARRADQVLRHVA